METKVPEVRFYLLSPAAEILRAAEGALPILRLGEVEDPRPLMQAAGNRQVPWAAATGAVGEPSPLWAAACLGATAGPLAGLLYFSRRNRKRPRRARS